jgi:hypothetical protein
MNRAVKSGGVLVATILSSAAWAQKPCDELKTEIAAKLSAKGVANYTLDVVSNDAVKDQKVVGSCEGGTKKIVYSRSGAAAGNAPAEAAPNPAT